MERKALYILIKGRKIQLFFILSLIIFLSACRSTSFIPDDQALVREAEIKIADKIQNSDLSNLEYELSQLIQQPPPSKFIFVPRDYYDLKNQSPSDTSKWKNFIRKYIATEHQIFDSLKVASSAYEMQRYLQNKKGFYDATVKSSYKVNAKKAKTEFVVDLQTQFKVDSIFYRSNVPEIQIILDEIEPEAYIKSGNPIDAAAFETEKERIFQALQNKGYANFLSKNIRIKGDSSEVEKRINVLFELNASSTSNTFVKYHIGKINVYTDYIQDRAYPKVPSIVIRGNNYFSQSKNFVIKPRSIDRQIFIKSGDLYNRSKYYQSIKQLSALSTYKFVKLSPSYDTQVDTLINYDVYLTPHSTKWSYDVGLGAFYSTFNTSFANRLLGFAADGSLINRNAFGGSEKNESFGEAGLEFAILGRNQPSFFRTNAINLGLSNVTTVPRQVDYLGIIGLLYSIGDISTEQKEKFEVATSTNFSVGWNFQDVLNFYKINNFSAKVGYTYKPTNNWEISFSPTGFNVLDYESRPAWVTILDASPLLENSFKSVVFSGIFFKEISALYQKPATVKGLSWSMFGNFELSGGEIELLNQAYNAITKRNVNFQLSNSLGFAKFAKLQLDWRLHKKLNEYSAFAARVNFGIAKPYANSESVPYIRQFFVGGPNSMRAWQARELGPGGYSDLLLFPTPDVRFYQAGDIKMEANIEYRSDLFWRLEYALFVDAGNIWTLELDASRDNTQLTNLYEQLAVGWGWGLRIDWDYFILRFDFAYRLKNPYLLNEGTPLETYYQSPIKQGFFGNPTIAINYPF